MKNTPQFKTAVDSMDLGLLDSKVAVFDDAQRTFSRYYRDRVQIPKQYIGRQKYLDSLRRTKEKADSVRYRDEYNSNGTIDQLVDSTTESSSPALQQLTNTRQIQKRVIIPADTVRLKEQLASGQPATVQPTTRQQIASPAVREKIARKKIPPKTATDSLKQLPVSRINIDSIFNVKRNQGQGMRHALAETRNIKNKLTVQTNRIRNQQLMITKYQIEVNKKYAQAFACLVMFLIGAPLGAIIKKGGLGVPVIISIIFFILYYVMSITGKKWAEEGVVTPFIGIWGYCFFLIPVGFFFLRQAKNDARLLESDFYAVAIEKLKFRILKSRNK
jgi:lipopolysaccharide export system permease protein